MRDPHSKMKPEIKKKKKKGGGGGMHKTQNLGPFFPRRESNPGRGGESAES